jgi:hypothetical protein
MANVGLWVPRLIPTWSAGRVVFAAAVPDLASGF